MLPPTPPVCHLPPICHPQTVPLKYMSMPAHVFTTVTSVQGNYQEPICIILFIQLSLPIVTRVYSLEYARSTQQPFDSLCEGQLQELIPVGHTGAAHGSCGRTAVACLLHWSAWLREAMKCNAGLLLSAVRLWVEAPALFTLKVPAIVRQSLQRLGWCILGHTAVGSQTAC